MGRSDPLEGKLLMCARGLFSVYSKAQNREVRVKENTPEPQTGEEKERKGKIRLKRRMRRVNKKEGAQKKNSAPYRPTQHQTMMDLIGDLQMV